MPFGMSSVQAESITDKMEGAMGVRVAINGFGRIGRFVVRIVTLVVVKLNRDSVTASDGYLAPRFVHVDWLLDWGKRLSAAVQVTFSRD